MMMIRIALPYRVRARVTVTVKWGRAMHRDTGQVSPGVCITVTVYSGSTTSAKVCALLSVILVRIFVHRKTGR